METIGRPWHDWCRLCAKEDAENYVNIHTDNHQPSTADEDVQINIKEALEKYFWVQSSCEDLLPQQLCLDCYTLISSIMLFNKSVERVQQMYKFLLEHPTNSDCDLQSVRIKFDLSDGDRKQSWHFQNKTNESVPEHYQEAKEEIESDFSEYEENDVDNESVNLEAVIYDEENINSDSQEDDVDPFETMSEDNFWGEEDEQMDPTGGRTKRTSPRDIKLDAYNTLTTSKDNIRRGQLRDYNCTKKKKPVEDFVFHVACKECGQKFDLYSTYCEHMEETHGNASMDKFCPICDRNLQTWYHLGRHMRVHMPLEYRKPIKCPECDNRYNTSSQLDVHIKHKHRNEKPFICEVCGFRGGTKQSLQQHMLRHTNNAPFECEVCHKKFKLRSRLNFHMDIHGPNKFVCSICGLQLNSRATLRNHMFTHSDEMRHKCDYCGKGFKRSHYLKNHLLLHAGLKPYSCNFCDHTFSGRALCRMHMTSKHPDKLDSIDASDKKTYTSNLPRLETLKALAKDPNKLSNIERISKGSISCEFCDGKFSFPQNCRYHMKTKHPDEFATMEANRVRIKKKPKKKIVINWFNFGTSEVCDFCHRTYVNRIVCRAHIRRVHLEEMATAGNKTQNNYIPELETPKTETIADNLAPKIVIKFSDSLTDALQSMEKPKLPLDLTPSGSTTTATNMEDYFLILD